VCNIFWSVVYVRESTRAIVLTFCLILYIYIYIRIYIYIYIYICTVIPRLTSDPANEFFG